MQKYLEIGRIVAVQGLKGEVRIEPWCDSAEFFCSFDRLYFAKGETSVEIERSRPHKNIVVAKLKGTDTVEDAQMLRGKILYMDRDDAELEEGRYFVQDLLGLTVKDVDNGSVYGRITAVSPTGANDVYEIKNDDGNVYYIPAIPDVVVKTDIENGEMLIRKMDGLFE